MAAPRWKADDITQGASTAVYPPAMGPLSERERERERERDKI
jgi:hypothetical protein